jgi:NitT/TauT family transport system substrate-binding protein
MWKKLATAALCAIAFGGAAQAEVSAVNMSKQFGLPYLPMIVIEAQQLIEKNAKAAGLGEPTRGDTPPHRPALSPQGSPGVAE